MAKPTESSSPVELSQAREEQGASTKVPERAGTQSFELRLEEAERMLGADPAQALVRFTQLLRDSEDPVLKTRVLFGIAKANEGLRDYSAAARTYAIYLEKFPNGSERAAAWKGKGACEAELGYWLQSADSFGRLAAEMERRSGRSAGMLIEALARQGYALVFLERLEEAELVLEEADKVFERVKRENQERLDDLYFVAMARFYRAAVFHHRFREIEIRLPESEMAALFQEKLDRLQDAQMAYGKVISTRHLFWVSAAGYQLGSLFEEFYNALMDAPIPEWLNQRQRALYYEELKKQLRPVVEKAIWVFEKNMEVARKFGFENKFIEETEQQLAQLQSILLAGDERWGQPIRLLGFDSIDGNAENAGALWGSQKGQNSDDLGDDEPGQVGVADRKLFVPIPTPL